MKIFYIILLSVVLNSCSSKNNYKYTIYNVRGVEYKTNRLLFDDDGCVKGWDVENNKEFLVCGSYTIVSNN